MALEARRQGNVLCHERSRDVIFIIAETGDGRHYYAVTEGVGPNFQRGG